MIFQIMDNSNKFLVYVVLFILLPKILIYFFFSLVLVLWLVMMAHEYTAWRCCTPSLGTDSKRQALEVAEKLLTELF